LKGLLFSKGFDQKKIGSSLLKWDEMQPISGRFIIGRNRHIRRCLAIKKRIWAGGGLEFGSYSHHPTPPHHLFRGNSGDEGGLAPP